MHSTDPGTPTVPGVVPAADTTRDESPAPPRPQPPRSLAGRVLAVLRGDKYMRTAYPPQWQEPARTAPPAPPPVVSRRATEAD